MIYRVNLTKKLLLSAYIKYLACVGILIILLQNASGWDESYLIKELSVIFVFIYGCKYLNLKKLKFISLEVLIVVLLISIGVICTREFNFVFFASIRQFIAPYAFILIGYLYSDGKEIREKIVRSFIYTVIFLCFFGFFERYVYLWEFLNVSRFFAVKNIPIYDFGYPNFWIEPIVIEMLTKYEEGTPRMVSTILDPINLGHTIVAALTLTLFDKSIRLSKPVKFFAPLILLLALFLTFSKGAFLQFGICFLILARVPVINKIILVVVLMVAISFYITEHAGFMVHWLGLINVFNYLSVFGSGFGSFGNVSIMYGQNYIPHVGDSYWAAIIGQLGIFGFVMWLIVWYSVYIKIKDENTLSVLLIAQIIVSGLSENAFNFMSISFLMIMIGLSLGSKFQSK